MKRLGLVAMLSVSVMAYAGCKKTQKGPPTVANKKQAVTRPSNAQSMGKTTNKLSAPKAPANAPQINTIQPGDDGDAEYSWQEDIDGDGTPDDVQEIVDDETGDVVLAASWAAPCDDGSSFNATMFIIMHSDFTGSYLFASDDVCGEGASLYGCDFDANGNDKACGSCTIPADGTDFTCQETTPATTSQL
jgi:hypothetical protein